MNRNEHKYRIVPKPSGGWVVQVQCPVQGYRGIAVVGSEEEAERVIKNRERPVKYYGYGGWVNTG